MLVGVSTVGLEVQVGSGVTGKTVRGTAVHRSGVQVAIEASSLEVSKSTDKMALTPITTAKVVNKIMIVRCRLSNPISYAYIISSKMHNNESFFEILLTNIIGEGVHPTNSVVRIFTLYQFFNKIYTLSSTIISIT